jgi:hypothetical protein
MILNTRKFKMAITKEQTKEFGMVLVLISIFLSIHKRDYNYMKVAFILTLITILVPIIFYPIAFCWFGLGKLLGNIGSVILLSIIFLLVVVPVGLVRRLLGFDNLNLKKFKKDTRSVMIIRNHLYTDDDLLHTF